MNDNKTTIISLLSNIKRDGMDKVIEYLQTSNYFTVGCHGHHREEGGVAQHSLEVYEHMMSHNHLGLSEESITIAALFHDLGKTVNGRNGKYRGMIHDQRSLIILDELGLKLTDDERLAIQNHHKSAASLFCPLFLLTVYGDCASTGAWKKDHPGDLKKKRRAR